MHHICWKEKGHGWVSLKNAMKQSCDTYFYETARLLGVDRLNITAKMYMTNITVFVESHSFTLQLSSFVKRNRDNYKKLLYQLANSIIFPDQYN